MKIVELNHISRIYHTGDRDIYALKDVSFSVEPGEFTAILGPSGAGKSTLLNILGGIDRADSGTAEVAGQEITGLTEKELSFYRAGKVGFVFQFYNLIPTLTVKENVDLMRELKREALPAAEVLKKVGLSGHEEKFPDQLSGGEQQRVSIARALAGNPSVILADEPTGALDSRTGREVLGFLQKLNQEGDTVVLITHDNSIAVKAKRIVRLQDGRIIYDGDASDPAAVVQPEETGADGEVGV